MAAAAMETEVLTGRRITHQLTGASRWPTTRAARVFSLISQLD
jgi:hypothetical protein